MLPHDPMLPQSARRSRFKGFTAVSFHVLSCECPRSAVRCDPRRGAPLVRHLASCSSFFASKCRHRDLDGLQNGRSLTPIHGVISRDLRALSRFRLGKFARVQRVISETSGHICICPVSLRPWGQYSLEDRGVSITLGTSNTENL